MGAGITMGAGMRGGFTTGFTMSWQRPMLAMQHSHLNPRLLSVPVSVQELVTELLSL